MFITHQSNRLESLFATLVDVVKKPLENVFSPETIIVQSQGMARWISLELAKSIGISANIDCPFPASFIWRLFQHLDPELQRLPVSPYDPQSLVWSVMAKIKELRGDGDFAEISSFLAVDESDLRAYQLAAQIALLFDQYLMHRPEWIMAWSAGNLVGGLGAGEVWQAKLWQAIVAEHGAGKHRAALFNTFIAGLDETILQTVGCERLCLFGIPALSQLHLDVFVHLSKFLDVHLFLLSPCAEFTDDLIDVRQLERMVLQSADTAPSMEYYELGCPLLMSLGKMGLDFAAMLNSYGLLSSVPDGCYVLPPVDSALALVHSDLLQGTAEGLSTPVTVPEQDRSIQIHSAHSPMREVEILHDTLLDLCNADAELEPHDIIVMVPDISQYASLIDAVFSTAASALKIPYSIADQSGSDLIVIAFLELLQVVSSRFAASEVLALLDREPIRQCFAISSSDMETIRHWVVAAGIRWGKDGEAPLADQVQQGIGTWQNGLDRLMLGFTLPQGSSHICNDLLPCDGIEGSAAQLLAKLLSYFEALRQFSLVCAQPKQIEAWVVDLRAALLRFLGEREESCYGLERIRAALEDLQASYGAAQAAVEVSINVVLSILQRTIVISRDHHFLSGKVTFCQMVPMRSIPFKVICLLGMNDASFPRQDKPLGFDLMKGAARPGDRCRRDDDRHLFLETLLSARQTLYISYVGQSDTDHRQVPPSTVVSELIDYLGRRLGIDEETCLRRFVTRHALQPFSRRYFSADLSSFSQNSREIAANLSAAKAHQGLFADYQAPELAIAEVTLSEFIAFFLHPVKYLLKNRHELFLDEYHDPIADRSCFMLDSLEQYKLSADLSERAQAGDFDPLALRRYQLAGELPQGLSGAYFYEHSQECALELQAQYAKWKRGAECDPLSVTLCCHGVTLGGTLDGLTDGGQYLSRPTRLKNLSFRDLLASWIRHLVLSAAVGKGATWFLCRDGGMRFDYYPEAQNVLADLMRLYLKGQALPLPLFPVSSYAYAKRIWGGKEEGSPEKALQEARKSWFEGGYYTAPEQHDPYLRLVYQDDDPFVESGGDGFVSLAQTVLAPPLSWGEKLQ